MSTWLKIFVHSRPRYLTEGHSNCETTVSAADLLLASGGYRRRLVHERKTRRMTRTLKGGGRRPPHPPNAANAANAQSTFYVMS